MASPFLSSSSNPTLVSSILGGMTCTTIRSKQKVASHQTVKNKCTTCMMKQSKSDDIEKCYGISRNQSFLWWYVLLFLKLYMSTKDMQATPANSDYQVSSTGNKQVHEHKAQRNLRDILRLYSNQCSVLLSGQNQ